MAERRMFSRNMMSGDQFLDLGPESQILYVHLCLDADDDGFTGRLKAIMRMIGVPQDALSELVKKEFLIPFDTGVYCVRHWRMHNSIRKDRYVPTVYQQEMSCLSLMPDGSYAIAIKEDVSARDSTMMKADHEDPNRPPMKQDQTEEDTGGDTEPDRQAGPSIQQIIACEDRFMADRKSQYKDSIPTLTEVQEYARSRSSRVSPERFYDYYSAQDWRRGGSRINDWRAAFRCWESREKDYASSSHARLLPAQQYSQRDYSGMEESIDELMERLMIAESD